MTESDTRGGHNLSGTTDNGSAGNPTMQMGKATTTNAHVPGKIKIAAYTHTWVDDQPTPQSRHCSTVGLAYDGWCMANGRRLRDWRTPL